MISYSNDVFEGRSASIHRAGFVLALLVCAGLLAACSSPPTLAKLEPNEGHPHEVIFVEGEYREFAEIVWDAGTTNEKVIPGPFLGAYMFSVPLDAEQGRTYNVALQNSAGRSDTVPFTVPNMTGPLNNARAPGEPEIFPRPRIDAVTVLGASFSSAGVSTVLYVQGANLDIGATVWVKNNPSAPLVEVATVSHKILRNHWFDVSSREMDYPIYHYSSAIAVPGIHPAGAQIALFVKNLDGTPSAEAFNYRLPMDEASLDSDGDGLLDSWETGGYDADGDGDPDIDLPALGASRYRRDLFLELDIMENVRHRPDRGIDGADDPTVFDGMKKMFADAPIINVDGDPGIHLVIDATGKPCLTSAAGVDVCTFQFTTFDRDVLSSTPDPDPTTSGKVLYSELKANSFKNQLRGSVYHYGIWGIQQEERNDSSGQSDFGDDFVISFDTADALSQTRRSQIEALAHEFGHNLGQRHGGASHTPQFKPNYWSVMSYTWDLRTGWTYDTDREKHVTCPPYYYASAGEQELNGAVPSFVNTIVDYSEGMAKTLLRPKGSTPGSTHMCGSPINWSALSSSIDKVEDFGNWRALWFLGPVKNGELTP